MLEDKQNEYSSPKVNSVEVLFEGIMCSSQNVDIGLGGWNEDSWSTEGDAN
jgi:hypothetical protein